jgi:hypothetical protein
MFHVTLCTKRNGHELKNPNAGNINTVKLGEIGLTAKLKQIVRMEAWMVSRPFDFVRNGIWNMLGRGFHLLMRVVIAELRLL